MKTIEIKHRYTNAVLYSTQVEDVDSTPIKTALQRAVAAGARLDGAILVGARLDDASLDDASLVGARLDDASLDGASLDGASLVGASLVGASLVGASLDDASLVGASLDDASLVGASLDGASLDDASLDGASLVGASLVGASLVGASLVGASLDDASLDDAILVGARLDGASLVGASLVGASLVGASLDGASLVGASLDGARGLPSRFVQAPPISNERRLELDIAADDRARDRALRFRERHPEVPVVEDLDQKVLAAIRAEGCSLEMRTWHTCDTTHCRGGWAQSIAGAAGRELARKRGDGTASTLIYMASTGSVPNFYNTDNAAAMLDIERCAKRAEAAKMRRLATVES